MYSRNFKPKMVHKRFHDNLFNLGCAVTKAWPQLHHVVGSSYHERGVWIGQWYLIPLSPALHMDGNVNVTTNKSEFYRKVGTEKMLYWNTLADYVNEYRECPVPVDALAAIFNCNEGELALTDQQKVDTLTAFEEFIEELKLNGMEDLANETKNAIDTYSLR